MKPDSTTTAAAATGPQRPLYLKDYERERLVERGEMAGVSDSEDEREESLAAANRGQVSVEKMSYDQEQRDIRERLAAATNYTVNCLTYTGPSIMHSNSSETAINYN